MDHEGVFCTERRRETSITLYVLWSNVLLIINGRGPNLSMNDRHFAWIGNCFLCNKEIKNSYI